MDGRGDIELLKFLPKTISHRYKKNTASFLYTAIEKYYWVVFKSKHNHRLVNLIIKAANLLLSR